MSHHLLQTEKTCAIVDTVTLPLEIYAELLHRIERLERLILKRRETAIIELGAVEDAFGMERTKEKRSR